MQLFVRCGVPLGTLSVDCLPTERVSDIKQKLGRCSRRLANSGALVLQHAGRVLPDDAQLHSLPQLQPWTTLQLTFRMRGGGGDGGSTGAESRSSYLEMYLEKKPDKVNPAEELLAKWTTCHLSNEPLHPPCVVDELGYVYNKEAILNHLLAKTMPAQLSYISGLKHVMELRLEANAKSTGATSKKAADQSSFQLSGGSNFACPVTGLEFNGRAKFVALRPSGVVVSEKAVKELRTIVEELAGGKWSEDDVVPINPTGDVLDQLKAKVAARLAAEREKKAAKKKDKAAAVGAAAAAVNGSDPAGKRSASPPPVDVVNGKKQKVAAASAADKVPNGATKDVYSSIFLKRGEEEKETFCCRALSARGMKMGS